MLVRECLQKAPVTVPPECTLEEAAGLMAHHDVGCLLIVSGGDLLGIVTDRDIVLRAVSTGQSPHAHVATIMSETPDRDSRVGRPLRGRQGAAGRRRSATTGPRGLRDRGNHHRRRPDGLVSARAWSCNHAYRSGDHSLFRQPVVSLALDGITAPTASRARVPSLSLSAWTRVADPRVQNRATSRVRATTGKPDGYPSSPLRER